MQPVPGRVLARAFVSVFTIKAMTLQRSVSPARSVCGSGKYSESHASGSLPLASSLVHSGVCLVYVNLWSVHRRCFWFVSGGYVDICLILDWCVGRRSHLWPVCGSWDAEGTAVGTCCGSGLKLQPMCDSCRAIGRVTSRVLVK